MASSSTETETTSTKASPSKLKPRKVIVKKMIVAKKRVQSQSQMRLEYKKTSPVKFDDKKTVREEIDNIGISQQRDSSVHGKSTLTVLDRAKELQSKLPPQFPSFIKTMLRSHVSGGFWLSFPKTFCDRHLPKKDATVLLVRESIEKEYTTKYLEEKNGLSGGWRGFSMEHNLVAGDVLIFQRIELLKFKVYIVRANILTEIDGAVSLLDLKSQGKGVDIAQKEDEPKKFKNVKLITGDKSLEASEKEIYEDGIDDRRMEAVNTESMSVSQESGNKGDELGSAVMDGIRFSESLLEFKDVKSFDNFSILVDSLVIDTEIPIHLRYKYYELCCKQKSFLHDRLLKGLNCKLVAGIISETVNIADAIKGPKLNVSLEDLQSWDKTLKAFEDMGMNVGFIRSRLNKLVCLSYEQKEILRSKKLELARVEAEMKDLEAKLLKVKELKETLDAEIEALMLKYSDLEVTLTSASWE